MDALTDRELAREMLRDEMLSRIRLGAPTAPEPPSPDEPRPPVSLSPGSRPRGKPGRAPRELPRDLVREVFLAYHVEGLSVRAVLERFREREVTHHIAHNVIHRIHQPADTADLVRLSRR